MIKQYVILLVVISFKAFSQSVPNHVSDSLAINQLCEKKLIEAKNNFGVDHPAYGIVLYECALLYHEIHQFKKAEAFYLQSMQVTDKSVGKENQEYMNAIENLIMLYFETDLIKAEPLLLEVKNIYEKTNSINEGYGYTLRNLADFYFRMGFLEQAEQLFIEALRISEEYPGKGTSEYTIALEKLADLYTSMGQFEKAEPLYLEAIDIQRKFDDQYPATLNSLAEFYFLLGQLEKAELLFSEALDKSELFLGKESSEYQSVLYNLAALYTLTENYEKAEQFCVESLEGRKKLFGKDDTRYSSALNNLANLYQCTGRLKKAEDLYTKSLSIEENNFGVGNLNTAMAMRNLGYLYNKMGLYKKAESQYLKAKNIWGIALSREHPDRTLVLKDLALLYAVMGREKEAESYYLQVVDMTISQIQHYFPILSGYEREHYYASVKENLEEFTSIALTSGLKSVEVLKELYNLQLATKSLLFNTNDKVRTRIMRSGDERLISLYKSWQSDLNRLAKVYQMTLDERKILKIDVKVLEDQVNRKEKELSLLSETFATNRDNKFYTWLDVKKTLKSGEAAVEIVRLLKFGTSDVLTDSSDINLISYPQYYLTDTIYYAALIVHSASQFPELVLLKNGNQLENRYLKNYKNSIQFMIRDTISYNQFWKPIATALKKNEIKKCYLSLDGIYHSVNLSTLENPSTGKYVLDEQDIRLVSNTKDLIHRNMEAKKRRVKKALLFGHPTYSGKDNLQHIPQNVINPSIKLDSSQRFFSEGRISQLPGTQKEIKEVAKLLSSNQIMADVYMEMQATEEQIKSLINPDVLHIATHGYFIKDTVFNTAQMLGVFDKKMVVQNPLLRSGLLLANSQNFIDGFQDRKKEDGILTAYEAMSLNLDETNLVVLSACETGLGEIKNGEGVYGLQRAFQTAGAKSVLMSLWKVDDNATQELIILFYKNWLKSGNKWESFKQAQALVKLKYQQPYYWGAFVLVGHD